MLVGQERYAAVMTLYFAERLSLSRAAELLGATWVDLRQRLSQLGIALLPARSDGEEAFDDLSAARWAVSS